MATSDPLRSLSREPVRLTVAGLDVTVPWHPAIDWIEILRYDPGRVVPCLAEDPSDLAVGLAEGTISLTSVETASHDLLEEVTGHRWWTVLKLVYSSASGEILGEMTLSGVDPSQVSIGQWCAAVYRILTRNADEKERLRLEFEMELPPPGYEDAWDDGNDFDALVNLAREYNG